MKKNDQKFRNMVVELFKSGKSISEISKELGVSDTSIYKWISESINTPDPAVAGSVK